MGLQMTSNYWHLIVLLVCHGHVAQSASSEPEALATPPVWNFTKAECALFHNDAAQFVQWPDQSTKGVPFRYCCEYQPPSTSKIPTAFNLSGYRYSFRGGTLVPAPYFDLGLIDREYRWYWHRWVFWKLPTKLDSASGVYCEVTDLHRLYMHRFWTETLVRGVITAAPLVGLLLLGGILIPCSCRRRKVQWEELFSDLLHVVELALVGSCLMEAMGHSAIREWRSQLMFNGGVVYTYLTLFTILSSLFRHSINPDRKHRTDWRWQKVFGQAAALFMVGAYLGLVEDVTGRGLEGVASIVLGTVIGASIWSAGVEMYVVSQIFSLSSRQPEKCRKCQRPTCDVCRLQLEMGTFH